jgi:ComF family protein
LCLSKLPVTNFFKQKENPVEKIFWGRLLIDQASSFLYLEKDSVVQSIIYNLKYNGRKSIGFTMGRLYGNELKKSDYVDIDVIVPVPLHKKRKSRRGYNQSEIIALGIGEVLQKTVLTDVVKRIVPNKSQTRKGKYERWINAKDIFQCISKDELSGKHILIVDDIITTGATVESLVCEIQKEAETKISVAVLASA